MLNRWPVHNCQQMFFMTLPKNSYIPLTDRAILEIRGEDRFSFLQGLVTKDVEVLKESTPIIYTCMLNPQGRYHFDFFIYGANDALFIDCEASRIGSLKKRLFLFKLRSQVTLEDVSTQYCVIASANALNESSHPDPRHPHVGFRTFVKTEQTLPEDLKIEPLDVYENCLRSHALPNGSHDLRVEKDTPLECGFDKMNAIDWDKGCYMGQELTARTKHLGQLRKKLFTLTHDNLKLSVGDEILCGGKKAGMVRSFDQTHILAMLRLEFIDDVLTLNGKTIQIIQKS